MGAPLDHGQAKAYTVQVKYKTTNGLIADTEAFPDKTLLATYEAVKAVRSKYLGGATNGAVRGILDIWTALITDLKAEIKKRGLKLPVS